MTAIVCVFHQAHDIAPPNKVELEQTEVETDYKEV